MTMFRRNRRGVPELNTSSLPDLIFTVLFFFMIVTSLNTADSAVEYEKPRGELVEDNKKTPYTYYVFIGKPVGGDSTVVRMDGRTMTPADVADHMREERSTMTLDEQRQIVVSISADKNVEMGIINEVKQALRGNIPVRINYSAVTN